MPLRTGLREAGPIPDHHQQSGAQRLVSPLPQPRRRRVPPRPGHQHQPPGHHERPQLPTEQSAPRNPPTSPPSRRPNRRHRRPGLGNYVNSARGKYVNVHTSTPAPPGYTALLWAAVGRVPPHHTPPAILENRSSRPSRPATLGTPNNPAKREEPGATQASAGSPASAAVSGAADE